MKKCIFYFDTKIKKIFTEIENHKGEKKITISSEYNFVYTGEIVARIINVDDSSDKEEIKENLDPGYEYYNMTDFFAIKAGEGILYDQNAGAYRASSYGFVIFDSKSIKLLSPVSIMKDKLKAYINVYPTKFKKIPTASDIAEWLNEYKILAGVGEKNLKEQLSKINPDEPKLTRVLIAKSKAPVNGNEEYFTPLLNIEKKAGEILSDGRIDYKEIGSIIQVEKDQEILERFPPIKPQDGFNILGDKVIAVMEPLKGYKRGENIVQSGNDEKIFLSTIDGCLDVGKKTISVLPIVVIHGDVNYDTGNIDFNGSVRVNGSVIPGFSVKASGDIIVENTVEDAHLEANGDITIKMGVVGKESVKIISGGTVTAKYLLNANVEAVKNIIVEDSIINCEVFANNTITVIGKNGKIIGGKTTALYEITVNVSGAVNETLTSLAVGRNLFIEKELVVVQKELMKWKEEVSETMRKIKVSFGEAVFENPKEYLQILPAVKKKNCLLLLQELSNGNKELKKYSEEIKEIQDKLKLEREPAIIIKDKVYPGSVIHVKKSVRKIEETFDHVKFFEDPVEKIIRFIAAT